MSTQLEGGCQHVARKNISKVGTLCIIHIYIYIYIYNLFISNKIFTVCTKKSHIIVPITNLNV
jgi:hypothetical protein